MKYIILSCSMILLTSCQFSTLVSPESEPVSPESEQSTSSSGQSTNTTSPTLVPEKLDSGLAPVPAGMSR